VGAAFTPMTVLEFLTVAAQTWIVAVGFGEKVLPLLILRGMQVSAFHFR
jgi:hypothetical protein